MKILSVKFEANSGIVYRLDADGITRRVEDNAAYWTLATNACIPLCDEVDRILCALEEMVAQHCSYGGMASSGKFFELSSTGLSANRDAMRLLEEYGRLEIGDSAGKVVLGNWTKKEEAK